MQITMRPMTVDEAWKHISGCYWRYHDSLKKYGYKFVEPDEGYLACGDISKGKYPGTKKIVDKIKEELK